MATDSESPLSTPRMSAEAGFDGNELQAPIRISGFISVLLGLLTGLSFLGIALLFIPLLGILFGCFALRRYDGPRPVGVGAAYLGIILSVGFGAFGLGVPLMKKNTLGSQGEHYAREFMKLVANGDDYYAMELKKTFNNRFLSNMPLESYYLDGDGENILLESNASPEEQEMIAASAKEGQDSSPLGRLREFREEAVYNIIQDVGIDGDWELDRPITVRYQYGREHIEVVFVNFDKPTPRRIRFVLECTIHPRTGDLEWHVATLMIDRERLVAESIL